MTALPGGVILDLKGMQYSGSIMPCCTALVVGLGSSEAKVEGMTSDVLVLESVRDMIDSLGGALRAGGVDAALLGFENFDCTEEYSVAGESVGHAPGASPSTGPRSAKRKEKASARRSDDDDEGGDDEDDDEDDSSAAPQKKKARKSAGGAKPPKKMIGRSVKVKGRGGGKKKMQPRK